jgi:hypothetical protein
LACLDDINSYEESSNAESCVRFLLAIEYSLRKWKFYLQKVRSKFGNNFLIVYQDKRADGCVTWW